MPLRVLLTITALVAGLVAVVTPSEAVSVPDSQCARFDHGLRTGVCFRDSHGGLYWLGTFRGYDGVEVYCIDYLFATDWGVAHTRRTFTGGIPTSIGGSVGPATAAALNHVVTRHPANTVDDTTAAAIGLIIREVMGDVRTGHGQTIPGGLTIDGPVKDVGFVSDPVVRRARDLWADARIHRGPWRLSVALSPGPDGKVTVGERLTATLRGRSGAGRAQDMGVALSYRGFRGPSSVRLGADGVATVALTAPSSPGSGSLSARVGDAPSPYPVIIRPNDWKPNPRPGHSSRVTQRGLVGRQAVVTASASASAVIVKVRPTLVTQASSQLVEPGASIRDRVTVAKTGGAPGSFAWSLLGPVPMLSDGTCPGVGDAAWKGAGVLASGTVATSGDGTYSTPAYVVRPGDLGCLTYVESRPETATTLPVSTPPGVVEETVLVRRPKATPCVSTVTSRQRGLVGSRIHDRIRVGCIEAKDRLVIEWTAHGPLSPRAGAKGEAGCERIGAARWKQAPVAARGTVVANGPGTYATRTITLRRPGCYTFSESVAGTATTHPTRTAPGIAVETSLITRPAMPVVPVVPTGYRIDSGLRVSSPGPAGTLRIAGLRLTAPVEEVGVHQGVMAIPGSPAVLGWLRRSARPDDVVGSSVIAGHVSDRQDRPGALAVLGGVRRGDPVTWAGPDGRAYRFAVTSVSRHPRSRRLPSSVFRTDGPHLLRIVTCANRVRMPGGGFHYTDNLVVTARAIR